MTMIVENKCIFGSLAFVKLRLSGAHMPTACKLWLSGLLFVAFWKETTGFQPISTRAASLNRRTVVSVTTQPKGEQPEQPQVTKCDAMKHTLLKLAQLSLEDYKWRSGVFKANEADRMVEQSIARMRGEDASYVRPMDADESKMGPLGKLEKSSVEWLSKVIDEEARRAETIVNQEGKLVRPIDAEELGPLGFLEKQLVDFLNSVRSSEEERARTKTLRPKDLAEEVRGPLGRLENEAVRIIQEIKESELLRMEQSRNRGGEIVRPIDVPGPLGEFELAVSEIFQAEQYRVKQGEKNDGKVVRPKDSNWRGPLGELELKIYGIFEQLSNEETERLRNINKALQENRPMETDRNSILGFLEGLVVGILRGPHLLISVFDRVKELMTTERLDDEDIAILEEHRRLDSSSDNDGKEQR